MGAASDYRTSILSEEKAILTLGLPATGFQTCGAGLVAASFCGQAVCLSERGLLEEPPGTGEELARWLAAFVFAWCAEESCFCLTGVAIGARKRLAGLFAINGLARLSPLFLSLLFLDLVCRAGDGITSRLAVRFR